MFDAERGLDPIRRPTPRNLLENLISLTAAEYSKADFGFLNDTVYSESLTAKEQQQYAQLLDFARALQVENPTYETIYHHLLHLYVLNGSRLDLL